MKFKLIFFLVCFVSSISSAEVWNIVVGEYPPFACAKCKDGGAGIKALREALKKSNVELEVTYLPWPRVEKEIVGPKYMGYFSWKGTLKKEFTLPSKALYSSSLIFIEPAGAPLLWTELTDLKGKTIGVTPSSQYFPELEDLMESKKIKIVPCVSDDARIQLVSQGRLDGALMDIYNAEFYLQRLPKKVSDKVHISDHVVENMPVYLALHDHFKEKMPILEKALSDVDTQKIVDAYLKEIFKR